MKPLYRTDYNFPGLNKVYHGKVRDVYTVENDLLIMVASDRISAFDVVLDKGIPFKGQVLNQLASKFLDLTSDIVPNWKLASPDPNVTIGRACTPFRIEMVIRGYLTGHAWRVYKSGERVICGVTMPDGLKEHDRFPTPIITPATKADEGHDEDISREEIIAQGIVQEDIYVKLEEYTRALFQRGTEIAAENDLILVDTKYEFGMQDGKVYLIDEIHTPDSSRYFYADGYEERQAKGKQQKQLSKEFVREWLMDNDFMGKEGQVQPVMTPDFIEMVSKRYVELYEKVIGANFEPAPQENVQQRVEENVKMWMESNL
ncbi:MAG: phosphoribosylaminoimidazolesuccinocarboxamide synthase [Flavobacteriales bacterium]|nr:phosphoribosylaminoimidazolesuccinocarboxamide synthase [Flavobacteriales bacterium]MDG1781214.1 phosphoribosylaminoimidazolesuccinocarboxamide synthase [Flavobacteriales bacterium]MDG2245751.1 phosphoribosylaminoimidazolesuccinocarboxamide synthase [Flavobacteriales bacterium]